MNLGWDIVLRLVTMGADLLLIVLVCVGQVRRPLRLALIGMLFGSICYLLNSTPQFGIARPVRMGIDLFSIFTPFWTWLFARLLFEREPSARLLAIIVPALVASWFVAYFLPGADALGFYTLHVIGLGLMADLVLTAWTGRDDDLIERRRLIRLWLPLLVAAQAGGILAYEMVFGSDHSNPAVQLFNSLTLLALNVFAGIALLRTDPELLVETTREPSARPVAGTLSPAEVVLKDKLEGAMAEGRYREPGLTIAMLADHLDVPEHRLRALINRRMGYRNFSEFLNRHRIEEAKAILADRDRVDLPVLTMAMDLGYNALPTFNRAFRNETGQTPTDFRRTAIGQN